MEYLISLIFCSGIFGAIGYAIGELNEKKNGKTGLLLGALLGPIGWIIAAVIAPGEGSPVKQEKLQGIELERRKVALLEAQLAELKKAASPSPVPAPPVTKLSSLDEPPVYHLD
jgi:hypothetical protein